MILKDRAIEKFVDSAFAVGFVTFLGGLLSSAVIYFSSNPAARTLSISLIAALVATNIARHVNAARDEIKKDSQLAREQLQRSLDAWELGRLAGDVRNPFLHDVARRLMSRLDVALRQPNFARPGPRGMWRQRLE